MKSLLSISQREMISRLFTGSLTTYVFGINFRDSLVAVLDP